tara:strand:+ start:2650 stop:2775 length:126 start_codon:yes stop_codon:yes gene_type:complete
MDKLEKITKELDWIQRLNDLINERLEDCKKQFEQIEKDTKQ